MARPRKTPILPISTKPPPLPVAPPEEMEETAPPRRGFVPPTWEYAPSAARIAEVIAACGGSSGDAEAEVTIAISKIDAAGPDGVAHVYSSKGAATAAILRRVGAGAIVAMQVMRAAGADPGDPPVSVSLKIRASRLRAGWGVAFAFRADPTREKRPWGGPRAGDADPGEEDGGETDVAEDEDAGDT